MKKTINTLIALAATGGIASAATVFEMTFSETTNGAVGDAYGFLDSSGNDNHGWLGNVGSGSYAIVSNGTGGHALSNSASSSGYIFLRDNWSRPQWTGSTPTPYFTLDGNADFTLEMIVNWNNLGTTRNGLFNGNGDDGLFWVRENGGNLQYVFGVENTNDVREFGSTVDVSAEKADGKYHALAFAYDSTNGELRTYVDGVLKQTNTDTSIGTLGNLYDGLNDFRLGRDSSANFEGLVDHARISDTALTAGELLAVPEPSSAALLGLGGLALILRRRK